MPERVIRLPTPLEHQRDFLLSPARHKVLICGRKWGKTFCCVVPVLDGHGPRGELRGAAHGARGLWAAPTNDIARDIWAALKQATSGAWVEKHEVERLIVLPGGGSITVRSVDRPDSIRGPNYDFVVLDEAAQVKDDAWELVLEPTMLVPPSGRPGWSIFISTPAGVDNWLRKSFDDAPKKKGWARWQRPSSDNPVIAREFLVEKQATISSYAWRQEYLAEFVTRGGGLFKPEDARYYAVEGDEYLLDGNQSVLERDLRVFITCDTATSTKTSADHTAIAVWGIDPRGRLLLLDLYLKRVEGGEIMRQLARMCGPRERGGWNCVAYVEENATSKHLLSIMEEAGVAFRTVEPGAQDKWTRAQEAVALWERHRVFVPESAEWRQAFDRQLYGFEPKGSDDDAVDAFAYAARVVRDELTVGAGLLALPMAKRDTGFDGYLSKGLPDFMR